MVEIIDASIPLRQWHHITKWRNGLQYNMIKYETSNDVFVVDKLPKTMYDRFEVMNMTKSLRHGFDSALFAERVKKARGALSQEKFGQKCFLTSQAISKYENADNDDKSKGRLPSIDTAALIAKAAGVSLDWLAGLSDNKELSAEGKSLPKLETYWDLYSLFEYLKVLIEGSRISIKSESYLEMDYSTGYPDEQKRKVFCFSIPDEKLVAWRESAEAIDALSQKVSEASGKFDSEVWAMAREGLRAKMEKERLTYHDWMAESDTAEESDDLPF